MNGPEASWLPDGQRMHLHHGPIDLIVSAEGPGREAAFKAAIARFDGLMEALVAELDVLRQSAVDRPGAIVGHCATARRMFRAVLPYTTFVTPMAAVAGAVADEVLSAMTEHRLSKAIVNNGGDIAFHVAEDETFRAASPAGPVEINSGDPARGLATSGWQGRSHSLGIADAVTVVARSAAEADVAATLIANAVDLPGHPRITRERADRLAPDSDLGTRLVTTCVGDLTRREVTDALDAGVAFAHDCLDKGLILAAMLTLKGETHLVTHDQKALTHA